jgi:CDP-diacylglycerol--glycerol-3-phosphate 3-phosphatidyltransferase
MVAIIAVFLLQYTLELANFGIVPVNANLDLTFIFYVIGEILLWISTFFAILSGVIYIYQNKKYISVK